jgi:glutathionylspermidine synthase
MLRKHSRPRDGWQKKVEDLGLIYHTPNGQTYWDESVYYELTASEVDQLERATGDLQEMCLKAAQHVIDNQRFAELCIPTEAVPLIVQAWNQEPPSIYGRFDFAYDGRQPPKLLEYNADTPTALLEAGVVQWYWLQDLYPRSDQFNSIHEKLLAKWKDIKPYLKGDVLYFSHMEDQEDMMTVSYLRDTAENAGIRTSALLMQEIGWDRDRVLFTDLEENPIRSMFKLYPWEWLFAEQVDRNILATFDKMDWMEPIWKMLWSNKGILAILWELFPGHPNLLEAHIGKPGGLKEYAKKPLLSREGANITLKTQFGQIETKGDYGEEGYIYQAAAAIPEFEGCHPVFGSWYIMDQGPAGVGVRESSTPVTDNLSRFVPHMIY